MQTAVGINTVNSGFFNVIDSIMIDVARKKYPKDFLLETGYESDEITDERIISSINLNDAENWECIKSELEGFFNDKFKCILFGTVGRWNGTFVASTIFDGNEFIDTIYKGLKDCDYVRIADENGHLYVSGTHHDGTVRYEIKILTDKGVRYLENWESHWGDKRTEQYVHSQIMRYYSVLPYFAAKVYGYNAKATA